MIWNKVGVYYHGDNPSDILGKYVADDDSKEYAMVDVVALRVDGDEKSTMISYAINRRGLAKLLKDGSEGIDFYIPDNKKYLAITDLNPTLVGQTITNNRTGESMKVKTLATYYDGRTQVSSDCIVRYISHTNVSDWYVETTE